MGRNGGNDRGAGGVEAYTLTGSGVRSVEKTARMRELLKCVQNRNLW